MVSDGTAEARGSTWGFWGRLASRRTAIQLLSAVGLNSYFSQHLTKGFPCLALNCHSCPAAVFACPVGAIQNFVTRQKVPLYALGVVGLAGALIGRASCGWFCPFGWLQELLYRIPVPKWRLRNRFNWTRYVVLALLVVIIPLLSREPWFCKLCPAGLLDAGIPVVLLREPIRALIGPFFWLKVALLAGFLGWMMVTQRAFCRWVCPLGALWSPFNPLSTFRLQVDEERCTHCNRCRLVCPVDIEVCVDPNSGACIRCLACVRACPSQCVSVATSSRKPKGSEIGVTP